MLHRRNHAGNPNDGITVHVVVHACERLADTQTFGDQDPFVKLTVRTSGPSASSSSDGHGHGHRDGHRRASASSSPLFGEGSGSHSLVARTDTVDAGGVAPRWREAEDQAHLTLSFDDT